MTVAPSPILTKQQSKLPTSMRYERVQEILENDAAFRNRLSPKNHPVETRFGDKVLFSKETVDITEALHSEGKDAHKVPKNEVIRKAAQLMRVVTTAPASNGEAIPPVTPAPVVAQVKAAPAPVVAKKKKIEPKPKPEPVKAKAEPTIAKPKPKKSKPAVEAAKPEPIKTKPAPPAPTPMPVKKPPVVLEEQMPESELPPEKQPLHLPDNFDPSKFPHYSVQNSIYCLLLSALSLAEHYEKLPGFEERQRDIEMALKKYLDTCNLLKLKTT